MTSPALSRFHPIPHGDVARRVFFLALIFVGMGIGEPSVNASRYHLIPNFSELDFTNFDSLSREGQVGVIDSSNYVLWSPHGVTSLNPPRGYNTLSIRGISADGTTVAGRSSIFARNVYHAVRWSSHGGFEVLVPDFSEGNDWGRAVSADGGVVLGQSYSVLDGTGNTELIHYWLWRENQGFEVLPVEVDRVGSGNDMTPDASVVLFSHAVYRVGEGVVYAPETAEGVVRLFQVSDDGRYASGHVSRNGLQAVRWDIDNSLIEPLGTLQHLFPSHTRSQSRAISSDGSVVLGPSYAFDGCTTGAEAYVWDQHHGMRELAAVLRDEYGLTEIQRLGLASGISGDKRTIFGHTREPDCGPSQAWFVELDWPLGTIHGDLDGSGQLDASDADRLQQFVREGRYDAQSDFNFDQLVDATDLDFWVHDLKQTYFGDANLDGEFNSSDMVAVFSVGQYEDSIVGNSSWSTGDWDGDREFTSSDLVLAFSDGGYEQGPRQSVVPVPEPSLLSWLLLVVLPAMRHIARCNRRSTGVVPS